MSYKKISPKTPKNKNNTSNNNIDNENCSMIYEKDVNGPLIIPPIQSKNSGAKVLKKTVNNTLHNQTKANDNHKRSNNNNEISRMMESFGETSGLVDMVHLNDIKL